MRPPVGEEDPRESFEIGMIAGDEAAAIAARKLQLPFIRHLVATELPRRGDIEPDGAPDGRGSRPSGLVEVEAHQALRSRARYSSHSRRTSSGTACLFALIFASISAGRAR